MNPGLRSVTAPAVVGFLLVMSTACAPPGTGATGGALPSERSQLIPSFPPLASAASSPHSAEKTPAPPSGARGTPAPSLTPPVSPPPDNGGARTEATYPASVTARLVDPRADVAWSLEAPPSSVDIARAALTRSAAGFELRVEFAGEVPQRQADDRTMNVASFYDVTGDGEIDYEIWANLADNGWGPGYLDRREERARFMHDSGVQVWAQGNRLIHRFPLTHLGAATSLRWAVASEWGSYEVISTPAAARDLAPDHTPATFPR